LVLSVPLSVYFSRADAGRKFRRSGLFLIPEEIDPPPELAWLRSRLDESQRVSSPLGIARGDGFRRAVVDPAVHALHLSLLRGERKVAPPIAERRRQLMEKALNQGPDSLNDGKKKALLSDPACLRALHQAVWELPGEDHSIRWGLASPLL
jgi:membrane glycosyltransferase